jgi:hypothetical protein
MSPGVSETALLWPPSTDPQKRPNILPIHTTPDIKIPKLWFTTGSTERLYLLLQISQTDSRASPPPTTVTHPSLPQVKPLPAKHTQ